MSHYRNGLLSWRGLIAATLVLSSGAVARADDDDSTPPPADFAAYLDQQVDTCVGPIDGKLPTPTVYDLNGFHYSIEGAKAHVTRTSKRKGEGIRFGIVNAIKDADDKTLANLDSYVAKFKEADVDGIIVGGDTAYDEDTIDTIVEHLAGTGLPLYVIIGNAEATGSFNHALQTAYSKAKNVINIDLVRVISAEGVDLVSLPGYFDRKYASHIAPCLYKPEDAKQLKKLVSGLPGPTVLISHGPPKQAGKLALDYASGGTNVGDEDLADAIAAAKIPFGIFGHIVEAGGHATDLSGKKEIKPGVLADSLYLNPGSANSVVWGLNGGSETWGMAALLTVEGKKAKYEIIRSPKPKGTEAN